jgi:hypothetical protein
MLAIAPALSSIEVKSPPATPLLAPALSTATLLFVALEAIFLFFPLPTVAMFEVAVFARASKALAAADMLVGAPNNFF